MELQTISTVSKTFNISTRTLRYYEQLGLLTSVKKEDYAYRTYDGAALSRLQQILILRKLRIPLKEIQQILHRENTSRALRVFQTRLDEVTDEMVSLTRIKTILDELVRRHQEDVTIGLMQHLLTDETLLEVVNLLAAPKNLFKEEMGLKETRQTECPPKLTDVRIVYLPPAEVASIHCYCDEPEARANEVMDQFVRESRVVEIKPDLRHYGFNHPNPSLGTPPGSPDHGYEMWVTIPEGMDVPAPLTKKHFAGGLYAAHMIRMGDFHEWSWLCEWAEKNEEYEPNWGDPDCMHGLLEEHLNYINHVKLANSEPAGMQLDLLLPIKERKKG